MITIESITNRNLSAALLTCTFNKPSTLSVGDLMLVIIGRSEDSGVTYTPPSGFGTVFNTNQTLDDEAQLYVSYKIATSDDVSASTFVFTGGGTSGNQGGVMYQIRDADPTNPIKGSNSGVVQNSNTPSCGGISSMSANCLLIISQISSRSTGTASNFAIGTDNPTWTIDVNQTTVSGVQAGFSSASALRSASTSTGNASCSAGVTTSEQVIGIIAIEPKTLFTTLSSDSVSVSDSTPDTKMIFVMNQNDSVSSQDSVSSSKSRHWNNSNKASSSSFTNEEKSI